MNGCSARSQLVRRFDQACGDQILLASVQTGKNVQLGNFEQLRRFQHILRHLKADITNFRRERPQLVSPI